MIIIYDINFDLIMCKPHCVKFFLLWTSSTVELFDFLTHDILMVGSNVFHLVVDVFSEIPGGCLKWISCTDLPESGITVWGLTDFFFFFLKKIVKFSENSLWIPKLVIFSDLMKLWNLSWSYQNLELPYICNTLKLKLKTRFTKMSCNNVKRGNIRYIKIAKIFQCWQFLRHVCHF